MRYWVTIEGQAREIDVQITPDGTVVASMDGNPLDVDALRVPGGVSVRIDGRMYDIAVGGREEARDVVAGSRRATVQIENERVRSRAKKSGAAGHGQKEIRAPMPGRVVKILVSEGDEVAAHQPVIVVEAMKMENELRAAAAAKVQRIAVTEGQTVEGNVVLIIFE
jgi:biotin carboxyl carrier protein